MAFYSSKQIRDMVTEVNNETATEEIYIRLAAISDDLWKDFNDLEHRKEKEGFFDTREDHPAYVSQDWIAWIRSCRKAYG